MIRLLRRFTLLLVCAVACLAQSGTVTVTPLPDIVGASTTIQLAGSGACKFVIFIAWSTNTGTIRIGDSTTSSTKGATLPPGSGLMLPAIPQPYGAVSSGQQLYDMTKIYYWVLGGGTPDKLTILYGQ
jgi:hypothetical protein